MNLDHPIHWQIRNPPSSSSIYPIGQEQTDMQEVIPAFVITLPLCPKDSVTRDFPGGTLQSLLQMIYEFYQEPVSAEELDRITALATYKRERLEQLSVRQESGEIIRRFQVVGPASYEGIRENELLLDT